MKYLNVAEIAKYGVWHPVVLKFIARRGIPPARLFWGKLADSCQCGTPRAETSYRRYAIKHPGGVEG